jgi:hypothetical protein
MGQDPAKQPASGQAACGSADEAAAASARAEAGRRQREPPRHYWGQALQHLDRAAEVEAGSRLTLLAKRDGGTVRFSLRVGFLVNAGPPADEPVQQTAGLFHPCPLTYSTPVAPGMRRCAVAHTHQACFY